jgi:mono/diheme cytochrome c family protein
MISRLGLAATLFTAVVYASAQEEEQVSVQAGVFTAEQAERGRASFEGSCQSCHEPSEFGSGAYLEGWAGQTASDLIEQIRTTMPQDNPGNLKRKEYVDVVTYLFQTSGLPAGETEMDAESAKRIRIEGPFGPAQ